MLMIFDVTDHSALRRSFLLTTHTAEPSFVAGFLKRTFSPPKSATLLHARRSALRPGGLQRLSRAGEDSRAVVSSPTVVSCCCRPRLLATRLMIAMTICQGVIVHYPSPLTYTWRSRIYPISDEFNLYHRLVTYRNMNSRIFQ